MPYNTRRKSLSLPSLGMGLPGYSPSSIDSQHIAKKSKRSHGSSVTFGPSTPHFDKQRRKRSNRVADPSSPPPPADAAVEKADNQPHHLAAVPSLATCIVRGLDKKLVGIHPRQEEDVGTRSPGRLSPSPELDLSDYDSNATDPFSNQSHPHSTATVAHHRRAQSPPLERDEREFTQIASIVQQRRKTLEAERERSARISVESTQTSDVVTDEVPQCVGETEDSAAQKDWEAAVVLFDQMGHVDSLQTTIAPSSPILRPSLHLRVPHDTGLVDDWRMKSPEATRLDELDEILGGL